MKRPYYLFSNGRLRRKQNTFFLDRKEYARSAGTEPNDSGVPPDAPLAGRSPFPVEQVDSIHLFGEIDINTKLIAFLAKHNIPLFCFDYYGNFTASLYPRDFLLSGALKVAQARHYLRKQLRLTIARELVDTAMANMLRVLRYYRTRIGDERIQEAIISIEARQKGIATCSDIEQLMGMEGSSRESYYRSWPAMLGDAGKAFPFERRERRPPSNELNALISFGNAMCYTSCIRQIYRTALDPTISFLHEPGYRRFSLALDIAEVFKPLLVDRAIFRLVKNGEIRPAHFEQRLGGMYLSEKGRTIFVKHWDERLSQTIMHRSINKKVSYERLIRIECYRLQKHLLSPREEPYKGFRMWW